MTLTELACRHEEHANCLRERGYVLEQSKTREERIDMAAWHQEAARMLRVHARAWDRLAQSNRRVLP